MRNPRLRCSPPAALLARDDRVRHNGAVRRGSPGSSWRFDAEPSHAVLASGCAPRSRDCASLFGWGMPPIPHTPRSGRVAIDGFASARVGECGACLRNNQALILVRLQPLPWPDFIVHGAGSAWRCRRTPSRRDATVHCQARPRCFHLHGPTTHERLSGANSMCTDHSREAPRSHSHVVGPLANGPEKPSSPGRITRGWLLRASPPWSVTSVVMVHSSGRGRANEILKFHSSSRVRADEIHEFDSSFEMAVVTTSMPARTFWKPHARTTSRRSASAVGMCDRRNHDGGAVGFAPGKPDTPHRPERSWRPSRRVEQCPRLGAWGMGGIPQSNRDEPSRERGAQPEASTASEGSASNRAEEPKNPRRTWPL
jgi:hypothetical protein